MARSKTPPSSLLRRRTLSSAEISRLDSEKRSREEYKPATPSRIPSTENPQTRLSEASALLSSESGAERRQGLVADAALPQDGPNQRTNAPAANASVATSASNVHETTLSITTRDQTHGNAAVSSPATRSNSNEVLQLHAGANQSSSEISANLTAASYQATGPLRDMRAAAKSPPSNTLTLPLRGTSEGMKSTKATQALVSSSHVQTSRDSRNSECLNPGASSARALSPEIPIYIPEQSRRRTYISSIEPTDEYGQPLKAGIRYFVGAPLPGLRRRPTVAVPLKQAPTSAYKAGKRKAKKTIRGKPKSSASGANGSGRQKSVKTSQVHPARPMAARFSHYGPAPVGYHATPVPIYDCPSPAGYPVMPIPMYGAGRPKDASHSGAEPARPPHITHHHLSSVPYWIPISQSDTSATSADIRGIKGKGKDKGKGKERMPAGTSQDMFSPTPDVAVSQTGMRHAPPDLGLHNLAGRDGVDPHVEWYLDIGTLTWRTRFRPHSQHESRPVSLPPTRTQHAPPELEPHNPSGPDTEWYLDIGVGTVTWRRKPRTPSASHESQSQPESFRNARVAVSSSLSRAQTPPRSASLSETQLPDSPSSVLSYDPLPIVPFKPLIRQHQASHPRHGLQTHPVDISGPSRTLSSHRRSPSVISDSEEEVANIEKALEESRASFSTQSVSLADDNIIAGPEPHSVANGQHSREHSNEHGPMSLTGNPNGISINHRQHTACPPVLLHTDQGVAEYQNQDMLFAALTEAIGTSLHTSVPEEQLRLQFSGRYSVLIGPSLALDIKVLDALATTLASQTGMTFRKADKDSSVGPQDPMKGIISQYECMCGGLRGPVGLPSPPPTSESDAQSASSTSPACGGVLNIQITRVQAGFMHGMEVTVSAQHP
ncbi:hypothetical protein BC835DRAFT_1305002 [Cytidiella melzeri]|nr:hypothetical protein BC835DRAFT_1305002 [Cytidiella melzeri]